MVHDLELSGWFRVLDRSAYIENAQSGITLGTFDFKDWATIGAEGLVKGGFSVQGDEITVELRLFDVYQNKERIGKRYTGRVRDFRRIAHKFVDEVINQFTGIPGVFNTRIAYVSNSGGRFKEIYVSHLGRQRKISGHRQSHDQPVAGVESGRQVDALLVLQGAQSNALLVRVVQRQRNKVHAAAAAADISVANSLPTANQSSRPWKSGGNTNLYLLDRSGNVMRRLTQDPGIEVSPAWSPDGKQIVYVSDRSGSPQLYILDVASGKNRRLTYSGSYNTSPDWSPRGDRIVYTGRVGSRFAIFTIPADGGEPRKLTAESSDSEDPTWSPDGRFIAFSSNRAGKYHLYVMQMSGDNQRRLTGSGGDDTKPHWSPRLD